MANPDSLDEAIDGVYQVPLDRFTAVRNELARARGGAEAARVRSLPKPNVVAWALNQLYWFSRPAYDRLVTATAGLRAAQAAVLAGKAADLRGAEAAHREALRDTLEETVRLLEAAGHARTPDTLRAITAAFEALPWKEAGRLARAPAASGFEALAGLAIAPAPPRPQAVPAAPRDQGVPVEAPSRRDGGRERLARQRAEEARAREEEEVRAREEQARRAADEALRRATQSRERLARLREEEQAARARFEQAREALDAARTVREKGEAELRRLEHAARQLAGRRAE